MTVLNSAGVYENIKDQSYVVNGTGIVAGATVITSKRGPTDIRTVTSAKEFVALYGLPTRDNPSSYTSLRFLNRASILTVCRVVNDAVPAVGALMDDLDTVFDIEAANPGKWGNNVKVVVDPILNPIGSEFAFIVFENDVQVEYFVVSRDPDAKDGFGSNIYIEEVVNRRSNFVRVTDNPASDFEIEFETTIQLAAGADDTVAPTVGQIATAWDGFKNQDKVNAQLLINGGWSDEAVHLKMVEVAQARTDSIAILDVPSDVYDDVTAMISYRASLAVDSHVAAMYGGWIRVYDQYNDREVTIPPSGDVAANFVQAFRAGERWDAVAGLRRGVIPGALGVTQIFDEGQRDLLYANGINPVTEIGGVAAVIWGQKTLQKLDSALTSLNVVTNVQWMTGSMKAALQSFVFQNNTTYTRDNVTYILKRFLEDIRTRDGLYAYDVICDDTNNTPQVIDQLQMIVDVFVQPVKAAEVIRLNVIVTPTGVALETVPA